ncbi:MAG: LysR family transcriptional regulator [Sporomusaceae bacterium]|nr:LysR family transcriptional regulator [Sporomusaceae bacterium]
MELRQLEYFCMVAKLSSFTRAAEQLHIAQPSVTRAIRNLEEELGIQLFDRNKKKIALTNEGEVIFNRIEKILKELQQAFQEAKDYRNLLKGTVKIGVPPMIEAYLFPDIFTQFTATYPQLRLIASEEGSSLEAVTKIENEELDLAIIILLDQSPTLNTLEITREEFVLCTHPDHPLCHETAPVPFSKLRNESFILLKERSYQREVVTNRCLRHSFMPDVVFSSSQIKTIKGLVAKGAGISFLMNMVVRDDPKIAVVPLVEPIQFSVGLAWKKEKYLSHASLAFVNFIEKFYNLSE